MKKLWLRLHIAARNFRYRHTLFADIAIRHKIKKIWHNLRILERRFRTEYLLIEILILTGAVVWLNLELRHQRGNPLDLLLSCEPPGTVVYPTLINGHDLIIVANSDDFNIKLNMNVLSPTHPSPSWAWSAYPWEDAFPWENDPERSPMAELTGITIDRIGVDTATKKSPDSSKRAARGPDSTKANGSASHQTNPIDAHPKIKAVLDSPSGPTNAPSTRLRKS